MSRPTNARKPLRSSLSPEALAKNTRRENDSVDERRLFRGRIIRAYRLSPYPRFTRAGLRETFMAARYSWQETEFQLMIRDGQLIADTGEHGDEEHYLLRKDLF